MKKRLKYLITLALALLIPLSFSVCAGAEEKTSEGDLSAEQTAPAEDVSEEGAAEKNVFSVIYGELSAYASEILCSLTFIGSLILAVAYKKGLLPMIRNSLVNIGEAINKIRENTGENKEASITLGCAVDEGLKGAYELVSSLSESVRSLEITLKEKMKSEEETLRDAEKFNVIMTAQTDMLYDIFMSSALPQYQKDAVGEKIAKMKEEIAKNAIAE